MRAFLNLPNILTILRITAIPFILYILRLDEGTAIPFEEQTTFTTFSYGRVALLLFIVAGLTDLLDGWLARKWNQESTFGKMIDPMADKFMLVALLICLMDMGRIQWWIVILILIRELAATTLRALAAGDGTSVDSVVFGKYKQFLYMVGIGGLMINGRFFWAHSTPTAMLIIYAGLLSSYISFGEYIVKYMRAVKEKYS